MSDQLQLTISRNMLIDRLRTLHSDLTEENRHTDALLVDLAIQAIAGDVKQLALAAAQQPQRKTNHGDVVPEGATLTACGNDYDFNRD